MVGRGLNDPSGESHEPARTAGDHLAWGLARLLDLMADTMFSQRYGHRAVVLETIAAVPGMVAAMLLHLRSLRSLTGDHGWIRTLLDEAQNERMHLMTFVEIARPIWWERWFIVIGQALFLAGYLVLYVIAPGPAHRMVGYLEEKAVASYSAYLEQLEHTSEGARQAPVVAVNYWHLPATATLRDVVGRIRDDECRHRDVNHAMAEQIASGCRSGFDESR